MTVTTMSLNKKCPLSVAVADSFNRPVKDLDQIRICKHRLNMGASCPASVYAHPEVYEKCYYYLISQPIKP